MLAMEDIVGTFSSIIRPCMGSSSDAITAPSLLAGTLSVDRTYSRHPLNPYKAGLCELQCVRYRPLSIGQMADSE